MSVLPWRLLALPPAPPDLLDRLVADLPVELVALPHRTAAAVQAALPAAELVLGDWSQSLPLDAAAFAAAPDLVFVQQPSVGVDTIDLRAAAAAGVAVANTAGANAVSVAEWCLAAALHLLRRLGRADAAVRSGEWPQLALGIEELAGLPVGVVGMGAIGGAVAARMSALGADVSYWSRTPRPGGTVPARYRPLPELLAGSRVLVVVVALAESTRGLLDASALGRLPPGSFVVNAARGGILDEQALAGALLSGALAGAALDVFAAEPLSAASPLRTVPNLLLSPHAAGASGPALRGVVGRSRENLRRVCAGEPVHDLVVGTDPLIRRRRG